jgi:hypothetical protein
LLTDSWFLDKGEFDELARTLQDEKVVFKLLSKWGNTFMKINNALENNCGNEDDENLRLLWNEREYASSVGGPPMH